MLEKIERAIRFTCMLKYMISPIIRITRNLRRFYRTYRLYKVVKRPVNSVADPVLRTRDHDYEVVRNG